MKSYKTDLPKTGITHPDDAVGSQIAFSCKGTIRQTHARGTVPVKYTEEEE